MNKYLPYDPGILPSSLAPTAGDRIVLKIDGLPPYKDEHFSIRNLRHKIYSRFTALRAAAIDAMAGRAPFRGAVELDLIIHAPGFDKGQKLIDYGDGIQDTLDGSHGSEFTYLPIVYEDDCQVAAIKSQFVKDVVPYYELIITFLENTGPANQRLQRIADKAGSR